MALTTAQRALAPAIRKGLLTSTTTTRALIPRTLLLTSPSTTTTPSSISQSRNLHITPSNAAPSNNVFGGGGPMPTYFQRPALPANTIIRFVPQQTAWIVERMGKFNRILQPGLAILLPFLDRIAYVKSLKEVALEIPSQSAITADNVTLELDGVLYTRVFDAYKARYLPSPPFPR